MEAVSQDWLGAKVTISKEHRLSHYLADSVGVVRRVESERGLFEAFFKGSGLGVYLQPSDVVRVDKPQDEEIVRVLRCAREDLHEHGANALPAVIAALFVLEQMVLSNRGVKVGDKVRITTSKVSGLVSQVGEVVELRCPREGHFGVALEKQDVIVVCTREMVVPV